MAKVGNEAKLILKLVGEKWDRLRESRVQTPDEGYRSGYERAKSDHDMIVNDVLTYLEDNK